MKKEGALRESDVSSVGFDGVGGMSGAGVNLVPKKKNKRKLLIIVSSVIFCVLVVVIISVVVVNLGSGGDGSDGSEEGGSCEAGDMTEEEIAAEEEAKNEIREMISSVADEADRLPFDNAIIYLDDKIAEYSDTDYEFGMRMIKLYLLLNNGEADKALEEAQNIDSDNLSSGDLLDYYNVVYKIYSNLGNEDIMAQYQDMYVALYNYVYGNEEFESDLSVEEVNAEE